ncbi:MAG: MucB/RseB C-terminal domain-containing protein [Gammaproteobacteria bacterium]|nr:MucB/RseB C-terminal domain-containing protein [Gammaproteobacteria bacterium]
MMRRGLRHAVLLLLLVAPWLKADDAPLAILQQLAKSQKQLNYRGDLIYQSEAQLQSVHIVHGVTEDGRAVYELMQTLDGPKREIERNGDAVRCLLDGEAIELQSHGGFTPFRLISDAQLLALRDYYSLQRGEPARVAGRDAIEVILQPQDGYRYGYRLWVATGAAAMLLKSELRDQQGRLLESLMFTNITLLESLPEELQAQLQRGERDAVVVAEPPPAAMLRWQVANLPPGFHEVVARVDALSQEGGAIEVEHHLYSDGLSSVSLFVEHNPQPGMPVASQVQRVGAVSMATHHYDGYRAVVVGEVPALTVQQIAASVIAQNNETQAKE